MKKRFIRLFELLFVVVALFSCSSKDSIESEPDSPSIDPNAVSFIDDYELLKSLLDCHNEITIETTLETSGWILYQDGDWDRWYKTEDGLKKLCFFLGDPNNELTIYYSKDVSNLRDVKSYLPLFRALGEKFIIHMEDIRSCDYTYNFYGIYSDAVSESDYYAMMEKLQSETKLQGDFWVSWGFEEYYHNHDITHGFSVQYYNGKYTMTLH